MHVLGLNLISVIYFLLCRIKPRRINSRDVYLLEKNLNAYQKYIISYCWPEFTAILGFLCYLGWDSTDTVHRQVNFFSIRVYLYLL